MGFFRDSANKNTNVDKIEKLTLRLFKECIEQ